MPSIRKRLKKLTMSKKSKSMGDLDQMEGSNQFDIGKEQDEDTCSQISEAITEVSTTESAYSYATSSGGERTKKKKRRLKLKFPGSKKKKEKLVKDSEGNILFRSLSIEHDPRGTSLHNLEGIKGDLMMPENVVASKSVGSNIGRDASDENPEVDGWRMSGLLDNVDRSSNHSLTKDNLIAKFEDRRKLVDISKPEFESTPLKEENEEKYHVDEDSEKKNGSKITCKKPVHIIEVSFGDKEKNKDEPFTDLNDEYSSEAKNGDLIDAGSIITNGRVLEPVEEEDITETRDKDQECQIEFGEDESQKEEVTQDSDMEGDSITCEVGHGKKVVIRHLKEVVDSAKFEMSDNVNMEDWLVLNIEKDDWVIIGYSKVGGKVTDLYQQCVDTI
eukprot:Seg1945.5 transcript_id=Seg1945.5/GoldUCD/mRNA.D3Y31 product="hypothetical protein" pseudo=true protein_id=Seg1945.5/GoldUCD/D3Y31